MGIHFYLIVSVNKFKTIIESNNSLINNDTQIFIMKSFSLVEYIKFSEIYYYLYNDKVVNGSCNEFVFEMVRDHSDPTNDHLPFLFYKKIGI